MNPIQLRLPDFMSFNFDPNQGVAVEIKLPLTNGEMAKAIGTIVLKEVAVGTLLGALTGGFGAALKKVKDTATVIKYVQRASLVGGGLAGAHGLYKSYKFYVAVPTVHREVESNRVREKITRLLKAFIEEYVETVETKSELDINCGISFAVMANPTKTGCPGDSPHTYEYVYLFRSVAQYGRCPKCNREMTTQELLRDEAREDLIIRTSSEVFKQIELILRRMPKKLLFGKEVDFTSPNEVIRLAQTIENGNPLLERTDADLLKGIKAPDTLTPEEIFTMAYYLVDYFKPLKTKVETIYNETKGRLETAFNNNEITLDMRIDQQSKIYLWREKVNAQLIPSDCPIVRKLYQAV